MKKEVLDMYVKAFLCEPANKVMQENNSISYHDLYTNPTILPHYLKEFHEEYSTTVGVSKRNVQTVDVPSLLTCVGPGNGTHLFIEDEGSY
eukprot:2221991-Ditylum_brightwellii.AAC.1